MTTIPGKQSGIEGVGKRLKSELRAIMLNPTPHLSAFPDSDNLLSWTATLGSPSDAKLYAAYTFRLKLDFPSNYPYSAPKVTFINKIWHPNVHLESGEICLDILKDKWSAVYNVSTILLSIQALLQDANPDSPLNCDAANMWKKESPEVIQKKIAAVCKESLTEP